MNIYKKQRRTQKFKETGDSRYIYQNKLHKGLHDMTYGNLKDLARRTTSRKFYVIKQNPKYDRYQRWLVQWFTNFLIDSYLVLTHTGTGINSQIKQLAKELRKPIIRKF